MTGQKRQLGDVLRLQRGHDLPERSRQDGEVPVVTSSGITGFHNEAKAKAPGVVTGRYGTLGEVFYLEQDFWPHNTSLYVVDFKGTHPRFASYFLRHVLRNYSSDKAAVPGIDRNVLHALEVRVPSRAAQEVIADILSAYDDAIENNRRRMALLEKAARLLYEEWFVRLRFPGYEQTRVTDGVPEGWAKGQLDEVVFLQRGFDITKDQQNDGPFPVVSSSGINSFHSEFKAKGPGIVVGRKGSLGTVHWIENDYWPHDTTLWVKEFRRGTVLYSLHLLRTLDLAGFDTGAAVPTLNRNHVHCLPVIHPPVRLMDEFEKIAQNIFGLISNLRRQNVKLSAARDLLLPRLMSGEIEIS